MNEWTVFTVFVAMLFGGVALSEYQNHSCRIEAMKMGKPTAEIKEICK
jgi:hypothetical protein